MDFGGRQEKEKQEEKLKFILHVMYYISYSIHDTICMCLHFVLTRNSNSLPMPAVAENPEPQAA